MAIRRSNVPATPVTDHVAAILLAGWSADPPSGPAEGFGDGIGELVIEWQFGSDGGWSEHEAYLRALAKRWQWEPRFYIAPANQYGLRFVVSATEPPDGHDGPFFFAEAYSLAGPQMVDRKRH